MDVLFYSGICFVMFMTPHVAALILDSSCTEYSCGLNQECVNNTCICRDLFMLHKNGKDCIDVSCNIEDCILCDNENKCKKCVHFIHKVDRTCLDSCSGTADVAYSGEVIGSVCTDNTEQMDIIIGVVAAVALTLLLVMLSILFLCIKVRQKRRHLRVQTTISGNPKGPSTMDYGHVKRIPIFDNVGFEPDVSEHDKDNFRTQVEQLSEHTDRIHLILYETRMKLRTMQPSDPRIPTYKGVIHQLCRVLVLLNKRDPCTSVPADGLSLIGWAFQMLEDFSDYPDNNTVTSCGSTRYTSFPKVCLDAQGLMTAVYAVPTDPGDHPPQYYHLQPVSSKIPGYYSSVPVTMAEEHLIQSDNHIPNTAKGISHHPLGKPVPCQQYQTSCNQNASHPDQISQTSSQSDYSQKEFTTFASTTQHVRNDSTSHTSDQTESLVNPDGLPFALEDATEPIEV